MGWKAILAQLAAVIIVFTASAQSNSIPSALNAQAWPTPPAWLSTWTVQQQLTAAGITNMVLNIVTNNMISNGFGGLEIDDNAFQGQTADGVLIWTNTLGNITNLVSYMAGNGINPRGIYVEMRDFIHSNGCGATSAGAWPLCLTGLTNKSEVLARNAAMLCGAGFNACKFTMDGDDPSTLWNDYIAFCNDLSQSSASNGLPMLIDCVSALAVLTNSPGSIAAYANALYPYTTGETDQPNSFAGSYEVLTNAMACQQIFGPGHYEVEVSVAPYNQHQPFFANGLAGMWDAVCCMVSGIPSSYGLYGAQPPLLNEQLLVDRDPLVRPCELVSNWTDGNGQLQAIWSKQLTNGTAFLLANGDVAQANMFTLSTTNLALPDTQLYMVRDMLYLTNIGLVGGPFSGVNPGTGQPFTYSLTESYSVPPVNMAWIKGTPTSVLLTNLTPTSVSISTTSSMIGGTTQQATVFANLPQASGQNLTVAASNWVSSATNFLTVSASGLITAVTNPSAGSGTISATVNGVTGTSSPIDVLPRIAPTITQGPAARATIRVGAIFTASVTSIGTAPLTYLWYFNSEAQPIAGATNATLTIQNVNFAQAGSYTVVVSNGYGANATSSPTVLNVVNPTPYQSALLALGPLAYWPLDETNGTIAFDLANGYNGSYKGHFMLGHPGVKNAGFGSNSLAAVFDGATAYVDIPGGPFNITNAITIMGWVKSTHLPTFGDLIGHGDASWQVGCFGTPNGYNNGYPTAADGTAALPPATTFILDGHWHFIVFTYTGVLAANNCSLYVDGTQVAGYSIAPPPGDNLDVWIGGAPDHPNRFLAGSLAHIAVLAHSMDAGDVRALYTSLADLNPVTLTVTQSGTNIVVSWSPPTGTLLESTDLPGPWTTISAATSPYTTNATGQAMYYKVQTYP